MPLHLQDLLTALKENAGRPAVQTAHHRKEEPYMPDEATNATHVLVRRAKPGVLGHTFDGPFPISDRLGSSCLKIQVGTTAAGDPRFENVHWNNCKVAHLTSPTTAERPRPGRKKAVPDDRTVATNVDKPSTEIKTRSGRVINKPIRFL